FTLDGTLTTGAYVELSWLDEHYYHQVTGSDTVATVLDDLKLNINTFSTTVTADVQNGDEIVLTNNQEGVEGNMLGVLGSPQWSPTSHQMTGGASPTEWEVTLDFSALTDPVLGAI